MVNLRLQALKSIWQFAEVEDELLRQLALHLEIEVTPRFTA